jgi:hypothetical protein
VIYLLDTQTGDTRATLQIGIQVVRRLKAGGYGQPRRYGIDTLATSTAAFVQPEDTTIGRLLLSGGLRTVPPTLPDDPDVMDLILRRLIGTGRCHWHDKDTPPLTLGPARPTSLDWQLLPDGRQLPRIGSPEKGIRPLVCAAPWYVNPVRGQAGPLDFGLPAGLVKTLLAAPPIAPQQVQAVVEALQRHLPGLPVMMPRTSLVEEIRQSKPVPCLRLISVESPRGALTYHCRGGSRNVDSIVDLALLTFDYDGKIVDATAKGTVNLASIGCSGRRQRVFRPDDDARSEPICRSPLSIRDHPPCDLAVFPLPAEPADGRGDVGRPRHRRQSRDGAAVGAEVWPGVRQRDPPAPAASRRQVAPR